MSVRYVIEPEQALIRDMIAESTHQQVMGDRNFQQDSDGTFAMAIRRGHEIVAGSIGIIIADWAFIDTLWVDESLRGQGIGRRLVDALESYVAHLGLHGVELYTMEFQAPEFYRKLGYQEVGQLPDRPTGYHATYFYKTALSVDGLADDVVVDNPVSHEIFDVVVNGLIDHAEQFAELTSTREVFELVDTTGRRQGGIFAQGFWGYLDVHLLYAPDLDGVGQLLDALNTYGDEHRYGIVIYVTDTSHFPLLQARQYERLGEIPNRPFGQTCSIFVRPIPEGV